MVLSGSMEPTYHTGSMLYLKQVDPEEIQVGDPITFELNDKTNGTHRVVEIDREKRVFITKGDNNDNVDGKPVSFDSLKGKPIFNIPYLGYFADFVTNPPGRYVAIAVGCVIFLMLFIPDLLFPSPEDQEKMKATEEEVDELKKQQEQLEDELKKQQKQLEEELNQLKSTVESQPPAEEPPQSDSLES